MGSSYKIIDEPKVRGAEKLIVNPILILFASVIIPIFWNPPFLGRLWMPLVWLGVNGFLLGSPTFKKEILYLVGGAISQVGLFFLLGILVSNKVFTDNGEQLYPFYQIVSQGVLFFIMYVVVIIQSTPYDIYSYVKQQRVSYDR